MAGGHTVTATISGRVPFNSKTGVFYRDNIEFPFFLYHLKGKGEPKLPEAYMFETGRNEWHKQTEWPPKARPRKRFIWAMPESSGRVSVRFGRRIR